MENKIYTHDEAASIVELFENLLDEHGISIPSPEDDERGEDNDAKLYGSTYADLLSNVEGVLLEMLERAKTGSEIVPYEYSGTGEVC